MSLKGSIRVKLEAIKTEFNHFPQTLPLSILFKYIFAVYVVPCYNECTSFSSGREPT